MRLIIVLFLTFFTHVAQAQIADCSPENIAKADAAILSACANWIQTYTQDTYKTLINKAYATQAEQQDDFGQLLGIASKHPDPNLLHLTYLVGIAQRAGEWMSADRYGQAAKKELDARFASPLPDLSLVRFFQDWVYARMLMKQSDAFNIAPNLQEEIILLEKAQAYLQKPSHDLEQLRLDLMNRTPGYETEVLDFFEKRLHTQPNNLSLQMQYAHVLTQQKKYTQAREVYERLTQSENAPYIVYFRYGLLHWQQAQEAQQAGADADQVRRHYTKALPLFEAAFAKTKTPDAVRPYLLTICEQINDTAKKKKYAATF